MKNKLIDFCNFVTVILIFICISSVNSFSQTKNFATASYSSSGSVTSASQAADGNISTYATLTASAGLLFLGPTGEVVVNFASTIPTNTDVYIVLSQPGEASLLKSLLGGTIGGLFNSLLGGLITGTPTIQIDFRNASGSTVQSTTLVGGNSPNIYFGPDGFLYLKIKTTANIQRVSVKLSNPALLGLGGLLGLSEVKLHVHDVFTLSGTAGCNPLVLTKYDAAGITLDLLEDNGEPINNPHFAIDGSETTYSELGYGGLLGLEIGSVIEQEIIFPQLSLPGEEPVIVFDRSSAILSLDLLDAVHIDVYNNTTLVYSGSAAEILGVDALSILSLVLGSAAIPDRISIPVSGVFNRIVIKYAQTLSLGLLDDPKLKIYDVKVGPKLPHLSTYSFAGCKGKPVTLNVIDYSSSYTYHWYDTDLNEVHVGHEFPYLYPNGGVVDTLLVRAVNSCGTPSAFQPLTVTGYHTPISTEINVTTFE